MQNDGNTEDREEAARLTIELVNHPQAPDSVTNAILETLIDLTDEEQLFSIWLWGFGLSLDGLTRLYSQQKEIGGGKRRAILYGDYEIGRKKDDGNGQG